MVRPLPSFHFPDGVCIAQAMPPTPLQVTLESPALAVMTDLTEVRAATIHPTATLGHAEQTMFHQGVRLLFVVSEMPCVDGIVSLTDLLGEAPMQKMHRMQVRRDAMVVADVMSRLSDLDAVDFEGLQHAKVGQLVATLQHCGRPHLLVVEAATPNSSARIRGIVSRTQVQRQLGTELPIMPIASSFADLAQSLS